LNKKLVQEKEEAQRYFNSEISKMQERIEAVGIIEKYFYLF
jgi:hypothetical protein